MAQKLDERNNAPAPSPVKGPKEQKVNLPDGNRKVDRQGKKKCC